MILMVPVSILIQPTSQKELRSCRANESSDNVLYIKVTFKDYSMRI